MNLTTLIDRATTVFVIALAALGLFGLIFGDRAPALLIITAVISGLALQVLLLAVVAGATVGTLKNTKKEK